MFVEVDEAAVQAAYEKIYELALAENASRAFVARSKRYVEGHWHRYKPKIGIFRRPLHGGVFVDYGSKFGHLVPLLTSQQVDKVYCLDVNDEYLREGPNFIGRLYDVEFQKTHQCLVKTGSPQASGWLTLAVGTARVDEGRTEAGGCHGRRVAEGSAGGSADLPEALRHRREVPGVSGAGALAGGFPLHGLRA
jgi:hypothetical protein